MRCRVIHILLSKKFRVFWADHHHHQQPTPSVSTLNCNVWKSQQKSKSGNAAGGEATGTSQSRSAKVAVVSTVFWKLSPASMWLAVFFHNFSLTLSKNIYLYTLPRKSSNSLVTPLVKQEAPYRSPSSTHITSTIIAYITQTDIVSLSQRKLYISRMYIFRVLNLAQYYSIELNYDILL